MGLIDFIEQEEFLRKFFLNYFNEHLNKILNIKRENVYGDAVYTFEFENFNHYLQYREISSNLIKLYVRNKNNELIIEMEIKPNILKYELRFLYEKFLNMKEKNDIINNTYQQLSRKDKLDKINDSQNEV